jgi:hypothetical protein
MSQNLLCVTHGKSFETLSDFSKHTRTCAGDCKRKLERHTSEPTPPTFEYQLNKTAGEEFAGFIEKLILYTSAKMKDGDLAAVISDDQWFSKAPHLLAHFSLDTPYLRMSKTIREIPVLQPHHVAILGIAHVIFNQQWDVVTKFLTFAPDGKVSFDESGMVKYYVEHGPSLREQEQSDEDADLNRGSDSVDDGMDGSSEVGVSAPALKKSKTSTCNVRREVEALMGRWEPPDCVEDVPVCNFRRSFTGKGYLRSMHGCIRRLAEGYALSHGGWPTYSGVKGAACIPGLLLDIHHFRNVVDACALLDENNVTKYFDNLFFGRSPFAWFGARRVLETHVAKLSMSKLNYLS